MVYQMEAFAVIQRLAVLGDSILRGVVLDEASGRYVHLKESCVAGAQQQRGLSIDNFFPFWHDQ